VNLVQQAISSSHRIDRLKQEIDGPSAFQDKGSLYIGGAKHDFPPIKTMLKAVLKCEEVVEVRVGESLALRSRYSEKLVS
jgi:hypothetical protein